MVLEAEPRPHGSVAEHLEVGERPLDAGLRPVGARRADGRNDPGVLRAGEMRRPHRRLAVRPLGEAVAEVDPTAVDESQRVHQVGAASGQFERDVAPP